MKKDKLEEIFFEYESFYNKLKNSDLAEEGIKNLCQIFIFDSLIKGGLIKIE